MALQVEHKLKNGITGTYLRLLAVHTNKIDKTCSFQFALYLNEEQRQLYPSETLTTFTYFFDISNYPYEKGGDIDIVAYETIKAMHNDDIPVRDEKGQVITDGDGIAEMTPGPLVWADSIDV